MRWKFLWCEGGKLLYTGGTLVAQVGKLWCQRGNGGASCSAKNCDAQDMFFSYGAAMLNKS